MASPMTITRRPGKELMKLSRLTSIGSLIVGQVDSQGAGSLEEGTVREERSGRRTRIGQDHVGRVSQSGSGEVRLADGPAFPFGLIAVVDQDGPAIGPQATFNVIEGIADEPGGGQVEVMLAGGPEEQARIGFAAEALHVILPDLAQGMMR